MTTAVLIVAALAGLAVGVFGTVLALIALDAHRFDNAPRRPAVEAARHGMRGRMVRVTTRPAAIRELEHS